jgi:hypothetical protein
VVPGKNFTFSENFTPPFPEKEVKRDKWVHQTKENFSCVAPRIPPAIKTQANKKNKRT